MHITAQMDDVVIQEIRRLHRLFPSELRSVLGALGFVTRRKMMEAISTEGRSVGQHWRRLTSVHRSGRLRKVKKGRLHSFTEGGKPLSSMRSALRYKVLQGKAVDIGAITPSAATYLSAVQDGKAVDNRKVVGRTVTPRMRRMFWARGVPLGRKSSLNEPRRMLVGPIFQKHQQAFVSFIRLRVQSLVLGPYESRDVSFKKAGF